MALYRADIKSQYLGQPILNTLWYEDVPPNPVGIDYITACQQLGVWIRENVINYQLGETRLLNLFCSGVNVDSVSVMAYAPPPLLSINPRELLTAPQVTPVNQATLVTQGQAWSPECCFILRLRCNINAPDVGVYYPSGGYLAIGPIGETGTIEGGLLNIDYQQAAQNFTAALLLNADLGGGFVARPIRVGVKRKGVVPPGLFGWSPITSAEVRSKVSFRRSRDAT